MKTLRHICAVTILSLTLAVSLPPGHIETPGAPAAGGGTGVTTTIVLAILGVVY